MNSRCRHAFRGKKAAVRQHCGCGSHHWTTGHRQSRIPAWSPCSEPRGAGARRLAFALPDDGTNYAVQIASTCRARDTCETRNRDLCPIVTIPSHGARSSRFSRARQLIMAAPVSIHPISPALGALKNQSLADRPRKMSTSFSTAARVRSLAATALAGRSCLLLVTQLPQTANKVAPTNAWSGSAPDEIS